MRPGNATSSSSRSSQMVSGSCCFPAVANTRPSWSIDDHAPVVDTRTLGHRKLNYLFNVENPEKMNYAGMKYCVYPGLNWRRGVGIFFGRIISMVGQ